MDFDAYLQELSPGQEQPDDQPQDKSKSAAIGHVIGWSCHEAETAAVASWTNSELKHRQRASAPNLVLASSNCIQTTEEHRKCFNDATGSAPFSPSSPQRPNAFSLANRTGLPPQDAGCCQSPDDDHHHPGTDSNQRLGLGGGNTASPCSSPDSSSSSVFWSLPPPSVTSGDTTNPRFSLTEIDDVHVEDSKKRGVLFADDAGYPIASVRLMHNSEPSFSNLCDALDKQIQRVSCSNHVVDLDNEDICYPRSEHVCLSTCQRNPNASCCSSEHSGNKSCTTSSSAKFYDVMEKVERNNVALESVELEESFLKGMLKVKNLAFEKMVSLRYTVDGWKTYHDHECSHVLVFEGNHSSNDAADCDTFSFNVDLPSGESVAQAVEFAICYRVNHQEYWDNNNGSNYSMAKKINNFASGT